MGCLFTPGEMMTTTPNPQDDGGPAFPCDPFIASEPGHQSVAKRLAEGMSLRDYFAAKALQGLLANIANEDEFASGDFRVVTDHYASIAFQYADAMLRARQENTNG